MTGRGDAGRPGRRDRLGRLAGPLLLVAAAAFLYRAAGDIPIVPVPGQLGPSFWPRLALIGLAASCLLKVAVLWRQGRGGGEARADVAADPPQAVHVPTLGLAVALLGLYVAALPEVGFALANALFLALFMRLGGARRPLVVVLLAAGATIGLLYVFVKVVYLPLPRGDGLFLDATLALYRLLRLI